MVSLDIHHTSLRACPELIEGTNGVSVKIIQDFSVHAEPVEAFLGGFQQNQIYRTSPTDPAGDVTTV